MQRRRNEFTAAIGYGIGPESPDACCQESAGLAETENRALAETKQNVRISMNYRTDRYGNRISALGYGCMRFSRTAGRIHMEKAEKEIMAAYRGGVNYFDTAYVYPGSEAALGEILERNHIRGQVSIATKLPHYLIKSADSCEKYFREQLSARIMWTTT